MARHVARSALRSVEKAGSRDPSIFL